MFDIARSHPVELLDDDLETVSGGSVNVTTIVQPLTQVTVQAAVGVAVLTHGGAKAANISITYGTIVGVG